MDIKQSTSKYHISAWVESESPYYFSADKTIVYIVVSADTRLNHVYFDGVEKPCMMTLVDGVYRYYFVSSHIEGVIEVD